MADRAGNKPPSSAPGKSPGKKPSAKKPPEKNPAPAATPPDAVAVPEKKAAYRPTGLRSSFILVTIIGLLWGFMAGVSWSKLQDVYADGYRTFNNGVLLLMLPFLMLAFSLSLFWLIRTPRRNEVKPMAISSLLLWLIYFFWEAILASHFSSN